VALEHLSHLANHAVAQRERVAHRLAAQIERAVAEAEYLIDRRLLIERERRRRRRREDIDLAHRELDLAGREVGVDVGAVAPDDRAFGADHRLAAQLVRRGVGVGRAIGMEDQLEEPERSRRSMKIRPPWSRRR